MSFSSFGSWAGYAPAWAKKQLLLHQSLLLRCMRVSFAFLIVLICSLQMLCAKGTHAQTLGEVNISLNLQNESLEDAFRKIEQLTPFRFAYKKDEINHIQHLDLDVRFTTVAGILT